MPKRDIENIQFYIRSMENKDILKVLRLEKKVYPSMSATSQKEITEYIRRFPEGQLVALSGQKIIGYCYSTRVSEEFALKSHTYTQIEGHYEPKGEFLYGLEMCVDPEYQKHHIGHSLHDARKMLCDQLDLKGIVIGCRMSHYAEHHKVAKTANNYVKLVLDEKLNDPTIMFQIHNGFEFIDVLKGYLPEDKNSLGYAVHLVWHNPKWSERQIHRPPVHHVASGFIRVATVQYQQRKIESFQEFQQIVQYFVSSLAEYRADFVVFPELFTMQLLSIYNKPMPGHKAIKALAGYLDQYLELMQHLAHRYHINIIGGSHPTIVEDRVENISYIFLRDGSVHMQGKIQPTPAEREMWGMKGTNELKAIKTDCGPIGILICYDSEFPELARHLIDQNIYILFIPFCTDERRGYLRVRYCAQARCIENQCYAALSGNVGNLPGVHNMNVQYAQSCILTPSDFPFSLDGIASETTPNVESIALADLSISALLTARHKGTVRNVHDRRRKLYTVTWHEELKK
jgi:predicted amidohydrolase